MGGCGEAGRELSSNNFKVTTQQVLHSHTPSSSIVMFGLDKIDDLPGWDHVKANV